jgi:hypothetical protein
MMASRTIITIAIAVGLAALAAWAIAVLPSYRGVSLTRSQRMLLTVAVVVVLTILIGWLLFLFPAYWD